MSFLVQLIYVKLPRDIRNQTVILVDPMLATGGSAGKAIQVRPTKYPNMQTSPWRAAACRCRCHAQSRGVCSLGCLGIQYSDDAYTAMGMVHRC